MNLPPLILASVSPRRKQLLAAMNLEFTVKTSDATELHLEDLTAVESCQMNAYRKASAVALANPSSLVIGADTLVYLGTRLFGKPGDLAEAQAMLDALQGNTHQVVTGVCLVHAARRKQVIFAESTLVKFKRLNASQINDYLALINPLDKAGGYAIQEHGGKIVESIEGSLNNVIGLPTERLQAELEAWPAN